jgi:hypothetical protein
LETLTNLETILRSRTMNELKVLRQSIHIGHLGTFDTKTCFLTIKLSSFSCWPKCEMVTQLFFPFKTVFGNLIEFLRT